LRITFCVSGTLSECAIQIGSAQWLVTRSRVVWFDGGLGAGGFGVGAGGFGVGAGLVEPPMTQVLAALSLHCV